MKMHSKHLVIFAKAPRLGRVKSRLAHEIGSIAAWQFYRSCLNTMVQNLTPTKRHPLTWNAWLALAPDGEALPGEIFTGSPPAIPVLDQGNGDLGHRMGRVFQNMPPGPVVIIGTDIPTITPSHITKAFKALDDRDSVLGPAQDGGYWLIGLKRSPRSQMNAAHHIFKNVRWSSEHALEGTQTNLQQLGLKSTMLERLEDVDDKASYDRWKSFTDARSGAAISR